MSQLPWTEAHWARVQAAVTEEFTKSSVAGAALPCYGPLEGGVESVPGQFLVEEGGKLRINDQDSVRLCRVNVFLEFNGQQVNDPNLSTVLYAMRRAANRLARIEDGIVFNGYSTDEKNEVRSVNPLGKERPKGSTIAGPEHDVNRGASFSEDITKVGLLSNGESSGDNGKIIKNWDVEQVYPDSMASRLRARDTAKDKLIEFKRKVSKGKDIDTSHKKDPDLSKLKESKLVSEIGKIKSFVGDLLESFEKEYKNPLLSAFEIIDSEDGSTFGSAVGNELNSVFDAISKAHGELQAIPFSESGRKKEENEGFLRSALTILEAVVSTLERHTGEIDKRVNEVVGGTGHGSARSTSDNQRYGGNLVRAVSKAISKLEESGYPGPFTCLFSPQMFDEAHRPESNSLVLPSDRITPMLGGPLLRAGQMEDRYGVVVATSEESIDIVVATPPKAQFIQMTENAKYRFRVYERFTLRIKDRKAVRRLMLA